MTEGAHRPAAQGLPAAAASVTGGRDFTCAVLKAGEIWCWGSKEDGNLGNGTTDASPIPVKVALDGTATHLAAGVEHACAVVAPGRVFCWGNNGDGQLGNGTRIASARPVEILAPSPFDAGK